MACPLLAPRWAFVGVFAAGGIMPDRRPSTTKLSSSHCWRPARARPGANPLDRASLPHGASRGSFGRPARPHHGATGCKEVRQVLGGSRRSGIGLAAKLAAPVAPWGGARQPPTKPSLPHQFPVFCTCPLHTQLARCATQAAGRHAVACTSCQPAAPASLAAAARCVLPPASRAAGCAGSGVHLCASLCIFVHLCVRVHLCSGILSCTTL